MNDRAAQVWEEVENVVLRMCSAYKHADRQKMRNIIAAYGQEQFRAGVEALRDAMLDLGEPGEDYDLDIEQEAQRLFTEQEEKG